MSTARENTELLKRFVISELGAPLFGIADTRKCWFHPDIEPMREEYPFAVVIGYKLSYGITAHLKDGPNKLYFAHYRQLNYLLDKMATQISQWLELRGASAIPIPASQTIDWEKQYGHFSHRHAAVAAGTAFWGRNNLAITSQFGAHQRWASILTDMQLQPGKPIELDCGECYACAETCPASAIGTSRDEWNFEKCFAKLKEFTKRGIGHYICGMCIKPCKGNGEQ